MVRGEGWYERRGRKRGGGWERGLGWKGGFFLGVDGACGLLQDGVG